MTENKESRNTSFAGGGKGPASEQLDSPEAVKKLTFALLDKIFESCPSLLAELKSRAEKEVKVVNRLQNQYILYIIDIHYYICC